MFSLQAIEVILGIYAISRVYSLIKAYRKKRLKFVFKQTVNSICGLIAFVWCCIYLLGVAQATPIINSWAENYQFSSEMSQFGVWLIRSGSGLAWIGFSIVIIFVVCDKLDNPLKYNNQEKEWQKEANQKLKNRLPKLLKGLIKDV